MKPELWLRACTILVSGLLIHASAWGRAPDDVAAPDSARTPIRARLQRPLTIRAIRVPLRAALAAVAAQADVPVRPIWSDEAHPDGLDPETQVRLAADHAPPIRVIENLLSQCDPSAGGGATWQLADDGTIEVGNRSSLNSHRVLRVYDVRDLLAATPDFPGSATLDLRAALQSGTGGGSVLREPAERERPSAEDRPDRVKELIRLVTETVEPEQWVDNGGSAASLHVFREQFIVIAPGYIHRQLAAD